MELSTGSRVVAGHHVLALEGTVDLAATPRLHDVLRQLAVREPKRPVLVDLDGVLVLDDAALGLLLGAAAAVRADGRSFGVVCDDPRLRDRLAETRFDRAVAVHRSMTAAVADDTDQVS